MPSQTTARTTGTEGATMKKIVLRLVPFVALMFVINFMDRTAISYAAPGGMNHDLGLTAAQFGFASGVFFIGYIILEVPSNLALHRFGARRWLSRIMVSWGIVSLLTVFVASSEQLYWVRFLLGIAEAGFFPGAILFLSQWAPARHRSRIIGLFYIAQPLTTIVGAPLATALISQHGVLGLEGWRFMFLCVSVPAVIVGVLAWFLLPDAPSSVRWLSAPQKEWLTSELAAERAGIEAASPQHSGLAAAIRNPRVWMLSVIYFGFLYGVYALTFYLPTIIAGFQSATGAKLDILQQGLVTAIPYVPAAVAMYFWSRNASNKGIKAWHIALPAFVGGAAIPLALLTTSLPMTIAIVAVTAMACFVVLPVFWSLPSRFLSGSAAAAGVGLINTVGVIGGFGSSYVTGWLHDATGSYIVPMIVVGAVMLTSGVLALMLRWGTVPDAAKAGNPGSVPASTPSPQAP